MTLFTFFLWYRNLDYCNLKPPPVAPKIPSGGEFLSQQVPYAR